MNATAHTAYVLDIQRAAALDRENEIVRSQRERLAPPESGHGALATIAGWLASSRRRTADSTPVIA